MFACILTISHELVELMLHITGILKAEGDLTRILNILMVMTMLLLFE